MATRRRRMSAMMRPRQSQKPAAEAEAVERFAADLAAIAGPGWRGLHDGVAVSGGPDSMALLWLMDTLLSGQICAASVDHGLRKGAADEAPQVSGFCGCAHIPNAILPPTEHLSGSFYGRSRVTSFYL